jgi:hypothetical protein
LACCRFESQVFSESLLLRTGYLVLSVQFGCAEKQTAGQGNEKGGLQLRALEDHFQIN